MKPPKRKAARQGPKGEGHIIHLAVDAKVKNLKKGKVKSEQHYDFNVTITVEMLDYVVRHLAGDLARAFQKVSADGVQNNEPKRQPVTP